MEIYSEGNYEEFEDEFDGESEIISEMIQDYYKSVENSVFIINTPKLKKVIPIIKKIKDELDIGGLPYKMKIKYSSPPTTLTVYVRTECLEIATKTENEKEVWKTVDNFNIYPTVEKDFPICIAVSFYDMAIEIGKIK